MDIRDQIIGNVMGKIKNKVTQEVQDMIQDVLIMELNEYELQKRCTEVDTVDDTPEKMLKKYIATKKIEGIADSTLRRYADQNMKLLNFLKKSLDKITISFTTAGRYITNIQAYMQYNTNSWQSVIDNIYVSDIYGYNDL